MNNDQDQKENPSRIAEEYVDENNNNKENDFEFVKPSMPVYRSVSNAGKRRPTSAPAELMVIIIIQGRFT